MSHNHDLFSSLHYRASNKLGGFQFLLGSWEDLVLKKSVLALLRSRSNEVGPVDLYSLAGPPSVISISLI